jgi:hypothetical protein
MRAVVFVPPSPWPTWSGMDVRALIHLLRPLAPASPSPRVHPGRTWPARRESAACFDSDAGRSMYRKSSWISTAYARGDWLRSKMVDEVADWFGGRARLSASRRWRGTGCVRMPRIDSVRLVGRVRDLGSDLYANACLAICPVFTGTGQPVKLLEALSYRVPAVAVGPAAKRAGLHPGRGGFVGRDPVSFANAVTALWRDRRLARQMGDSGAEWLQEAHDLNPLAAALSGFWPRPTARTPP